jgi:hypothetical protein
VTAAFRTSHSRIAALAGSLGDRDWLVLRDLAELRVATTRQIQRVHFAAESPLASTRACNRMLARLARAGLVRALDRRIGGVRAGSAAFVWSLDVAGQRLITRSGPAGGAAMRAPWTPSLAFLAHQLAVTELAVSLREAERGGGLAVVSFVAEPRCWRHYAGAHGARGVLKPDAAVTMSDGQYEDVWFVEVDLGTESPRVLSRKRDTYLAYYRTGQEQRTAGVFPWVLFVVPSEARRRVVLRALGPTPPHEPELFVVALASDAAAMLSGGRP